MKRFQGGSPKSIFLIKWCKLKTRVHHTLQKKMFLKPKNAKTMHLSAKIASRAPERCHPSNLSIRIAFCPIGGLPLPGSPGTPRLWDRLRFREDLPGSPEGSPSGSNRQVARMTAFECSRSVFSWQVHAFGNFERKKHRFLQCIIHVCFPFTQFY